jgi:hypothetical protein
MSNRTSDQKIVVLSIFTEVWNAGNLAAAGEIFAEISRTPARLSWWFAAACPEPGLGL